MIRYKASPTLARFHHSPAFARAVVGPIGSGKSSGSTMELWRLANDPAGACADGVVRSRTLIARNSYRELRDTTLATFRHWIPEGIGVFSRQDFALSVRSGQVEADFIFRSFDTPEDVRKLLSLELTHAWLNEARELPRPIFDMLTGRLGRFPPASLGARVEPRVILDSNPSDRLHWLYKLFAESPPEGYALFLQPDGLSAEAENIENLPAGYYRRLVAGKSEDWINVYVRGLWGYARDGLAVLPEFNDRVHVAPRALEAVKGRPLVVGLDFGLTPAAAIVQQRTAGGYNVLAEVTTERAGVKQFVPLLREAMRAYPWCEEWKIWGDPGGGTRSQNDMRSCFDALEGEGIAALPAPGGNAQGYRRETMARLLGMLCLDGYPGLYVSPTCKVLIVGMGGAYRYRRLNVAGVDERYTEAPEKNSYSHVCEALAYALIGEGEGYELRGVTKALPVDYSRSRRATAGAHFGS